MLASLVVLDHVASAHGMATPAEHQLPGGQGEHCVAAASPRPRPTAPASHGVGADEPSPHHDALVQTSQAVAPSPPWKRREGGVGCVGWEGVEEHLKEGA